MGNRLSKIYTRTGDTGETALGDGSRVPKDSPRVEAYGSVDELNSVIGVVLACALPDAVRECLIDVQHDLFDLGSELAVPGYRALKADCVDRLEHRLDIFNADLPYLKEFILPSGSMAVANSHLARTICRRAERRVLTLSREVTLEGQSLKYLNRLSDLLFVIARVLARQDGVGEVYWNSERIRGQADT
ncbi:MAG: cob(I)yrinic acid a,c-diamide adenosyltransferase [Gammaproteobacteria bacterium]|nr:cob(I)yrinic acid a,c-diamide adenosyltransferase [Gammaproteobacteria bacterium]MCP5136147.1 cob(I)yrinic acid a,c-diamide adenosyltransferase [Gammaproteobacteria bacterium]